MDLNFRILLDRPHLSGHTITGNIDYQFSWRVLNADDNEVRALISPKLFEGEFLLTDTENAELGRVNLRNGNSIVCRIDLNRSEESQLYMERYARQSVDLLIDFADCKIVTTKDGPILEAGNIVKVCINHQLKSLRELIEQRKKDRMSVEELSNDYFKTISGS